jgi:glycerophosphoryl diester phosphodiesterase
VVAHRGASADAAEHTLAAYRRALDSGADGLECDVRLTRDGFLVCVHDRRVDRTSSGRGVVSTLELTDLAELDFGSWHVGAATTSSSPGRSEAPDRDHTRVLTLARLLEVVVESQRRIEVAIETKHPTRYAGLVEITLVEVLTRFGLERPTPDSLVQPRVMSFAPTSLRRLRAMAPGLPTVFLMERVPLRYRDGRLPAGAIAAGPSLAVVQADPDYVARVHSQGSEVHVWTVDADDDVDALVALGVDVIITNRPAGVLERLGR